MVARNRFLEERTYFGLLQDWLKKTTSGSQAGLALTFHSHEPVQQDAVGYLPALNAPVTQLLKKPGDFKST